MSDRSLILQISNHHTASYGTPPRIEERHGQYLGYFENEYGEQMIFVFDRRRGTGQVYAGDAGWETPHEVVDGVAKVDHEARGNAVVAGMLGGSHGWRQMIEKDFSLDGERRVINGRPIRRPGTISAGDG